MITDSSGLHSIHSRLDRLERANRRLRYALSAVLVAAGSLFLAQCSSGGGEVAARAFLVQDGSGKTRASLAIEEEAVRLRLFDAEGVRRASLSLAGDGAPGLALFGAGDRPQALLEVGKTGPLLELSGANGKTVFRRP